uniref:Uncharacterized protein n=1 Tax=viral metagenome TaxID=1070528 RepID=A0A6C0LIZ3_9ZZZZ
MIFITFDPYADNYGTPIDNSSNLCIICLETENHILNYNSHRFFVRNCNCNYSIHYDCLNNYYHHNIVNTGRCACPICREVYIFPHFTKQSLKLRITHCLFYDIFIITFVSMIIFIYYKIVFFTFYIISRVLPL